MYENMGLYRGKPIDNGEWITGCLLKVTLAGNTAYLIFEDKFTFTLGAANALSHAAVIPDTVGECTGVKDKNGKLIFDGDIVRCDDLFTAVVKWDSSHARFNLAIVYKAEINKCVNLTRGRADKLTICGNIHDNPELLKRRC